MKFIKGVNNSIKLALIVFLATLSISIFAVGFIKKSLINDANEDIIEYAVKNADSIDEKLKAQLDTLLALASLNIVSDQKISLGNKLEQLQNEAIRKDFSRISIADKNGHASTSDGKTLDVSDRAYFMKAIQGVPNISDPIVSRVDNFNVISYAVPIMKNGSIDGVLYATQSAKDLWKLADKINYLGKGKAFIVDKSGLFVTDEDYSLISSRTNYLNDVSGNNKFQKLSKLHKNMIDGKTGTDEYELDSQMYYLAYAPIESTGWVLCITVPKELIFNEIDGIVVTGIIIAILCVLLMTSLAVFWSFYRHKVLSERDIARRAVNTAGIYIVELDRDGTIITANSGVWEKFFNNKNKATRALFSDFVKIDNKDFIMELKDGMNFETNITSVDGESNYIRWNVIGDDEQSRRVNSYYVLVGIDITDKYEFNQQLNNKHKELGELYRKLGKLYNELESAQSELRLKYDELRKSQEETKLLAERYMMVANASKDAIWDWDGIENKLFVSDRFYELLGYSKIDDTIHFSSIIKLMHPDDIAHDRKTYIDHLTGKVDFYMSEYRLMTKSGGYKWFISKGKSIVNAEGKVIRNVATFTDITERKLYEEEIRHLAYYDYLTGVSNRSYIVNELGHLLDKSIENLSKGAVFYIDVDDFRIINETFGHTVGDSILIGIANRLCSDLGDSNVSRIGGDEFIIVYDEYLSGLDFEKNIISKAKEIVGIFDETFIIADNSFDLTCSIGVAMYPRDGSTVEEILKNAELAMYKAKAKGKNCFIVYDTSISEELSKRTEMEKQLRGAIRNNEFSLHYQPQVNAKTSEVVGFEALIRWNSPLYGNVSPVKFIPIAEEIGLILEIGRWVIEKSFEFAKKLEAKGICISVNVSARQLVQSNFLEQVIGAYEMYDLKPGSIALEITESCFVDSFSDVKEKLAKLQEKGILIYLDDFGTGYSSLNYLKDLPIDVVKIDKSFVDDINKDGVERRIISTIISLSNIIGLKVVAEGVETKEQLDYLTDSNCNFIQGFYFSKPVPEGDALDLVLKKNAIGMK